MPIPLILGGIAIAAGIFGVGAGITAASDLQDAKNIAEKAEKKYLKKKGEFAQQHNATILKAELLAKVKHKTYKNTITHFLDVYERFQKVQTSELIVDKSFRGLNLTDNDIKEFQEQKITYLEAAKDFGSAVGAGAATGLGALGLAGTIGTASTGTAISTLSGAALTNATLAWFGGGSLATGGLGMAGGAVMLGGLALGPALAVGGFLMASKADKAFTQAVEYQKNVDVACEEIDLGMSILEAIRMRVSEFENTIRQLDARLENSILKVEEIENRLKWKFKYLIRRIVFMKISYDPKDLSEKEIRTLHTAKLLAKGLKTILTTPLIDKKGQINSKSKEVITQSQQLLNS